MRRSWYTSKSLAGLRRNVCLWLVALSGLLLAIPTYAQQSNITLQLREQPLSAFIQSVEQQTDFKFFYQEQEIDVRQKISVE